MADEFDASKIEAAGWRKGAVLCEKVEEAATQAAPERVQPKQKPSTNKKHGEEILEQSILKPCIIRQR